MVFVLLFSSLAFVGTVSGASGDHAPAKCVDVALKNWPEGGARQLYVRGANNCHSPVASWRSRLLPGFAEDTA